MRAELEHPFTLLVASPQAFDHELTTLEDCHGPRGRIRDSFTRPVTLKTDLEEQAGACRSVVPRLGVKGSQVQILSSRRPRGFSQVRYCEDPLFVILPSSAGSSTPLIDPFTPAVVCPFGRCSLGPTSRTRPRSVREENLRLLYWMLGRVKGARRLPEAGGRAINWDPRITGRPGIQDFSHNHHFMINRRVKE